LYELSELEELVAGCFANVEENGVNLSGIFLLRSKNILPTFVLVDKDAGQISAIQEEAWSWIANIQLCLWHVEQAIDCKLKEKKYKSSQSYYHSWEFFWEYDTEICFCRPTSKELAVKMLQDYVNSESNCSNVPLGSEFNVNEDDYPLSKRRKLKS